MTQIANTAIICTRNRPDDILVCLRSLQQQTRSFDEIIIVDSSDQPLNQQRAFTEVFTAEQFPAAQLYYLHTAPGLPYQRNKGIETAHGAVVYFFDDDVVLEPEYLTHMHDAYESHPTYGGGMGNVTDVTIRTSWFSGFSRLFLLAQKPGEGRFTSSGQPTMPFGETRFKPVTVLSGCCSSYRASVLKKHRFDERLGGYAFMEDCDMAKRVSDEYPLFYNPHARLEHHQSPIARDGAITRAAQYMHNYSYLFFKNFYPQNRWRLCAYLWSVLGLYLKALLQGDWRGLSGYCKGLYRFCCS